ncbi:M12 family metallopeptidase [Archangium sp.]|uniref:M12 family metallopeptidase n=1 Tax=Archangium sp. TaxID=1872627 RepID=UPI003899D296
MSKKNLLPLSLSALGLLLSSAALAAPVRQGHVRDAAASGQVQAVRYTDEQGLAILERDMVLGPVQLMEKAEERIRMRSTGDSQALGLETMGILPVRQRWPQGVIPYSVSPDLPHPERVTAALQQWQQRTNIRFVQRTRDNASRYPDYVLFTSGEARGSYVGRAGGEQPLTLTNDSDSRDVLHLVGHAIGLGHEQERVASGEGPDTGAIAAVAALYTRK